MGYDLIHLTNLRTNVVGSDSALGNIVFRTIPVQYPVCGAFSGVDCLAARPVGQAALTENHVAAVLAATRERKRFGHRLRKTLNLPHAHGAQAKQIIHNPHKGLFFFSLALYII